MRCTRCALAGRRGSVVLYRGKMPCDALFVGEGPGKDEDALATPFIGRSGELLNGIAEEAFADLNLRVGFTNLLACLPVDPADPDELLHPRDLPECVSACSPRLVEVVKIARPRLIVRVGKDAQDYLEPGYRHTVKLPGWDGAFVDIQHPSFILRSSFAAQDHLRRRAVVVLRTAVAKLLSPDGKLLPATPPRPKLRARPRRLTARQPDTDTDDLIPF